jgi:predicted MFS family arabinose efflux permease
VALFFTTLFFIFIGGRAVPAMTMIVSSASPDYRGSFMSFNTAFQQLAAGAAALISGMLIVETETSFTQYNFVGYLAVGLTFIGMLLASRLYPAVAAKPKE